MKLRRPDVATPEGLRRDVRITVVLSVLLLGLGAWNLWEGDTVPGLGCLFGATVSLWLVYRNYRIAKGLGWFSTQDSSAGDASSQDE